MPDTPAVKPVAAWGWLKPDGTLFSAVSSTEPYAIAVRDRGEVVVRVAIVPYADALAAGLVPPEEGNADGT
jgi:hypothetical protein